MLLSKQITVFLRLKGGLGNQLFSFAFCFSLAKRLNARILIDSRSGFLKDEYKRVSVIKNIIHKSVYRDAGYFTTFFYLFLYKIKKRGFSFPCSFVIYESDGSEFISLDYNNIMSSNFVYVEGYFQSYLYFESFSSCIMTKLKFFDIEKNINMSLLTRIKESDSVAVHFRRVDYTHTLELEYYKQAVSKIAQKFKKPIFFIFTDDLAFDYSSIFEFNIYEALLVSSPDNSELTDFFLMSSCKHFIIANSTFSWWTAYISSHSNESSIFAPKTTLGVNNKFYPSNWTIL